MRLCRAKRSYSERGSVGWPGVLNISITLSGLPGWEVPWQRRSLVSGPESSPCPGKWRRHGRRGPKWHRQAKPRRPLGPLSRRPSRTWPGQRGRALSRPAPPRPGRRRARAPPGQPRRRREQPCRPGRACPRCCHRGWLPVGQGRRGRRGEQPCRPGRACPRWPCRWPASGGPAVHRPVVTPEPARGDRRGPGLTDPRRRRRGAPGRCRPRRNRAARRGREYCRVRQPRRNRQNQSHPGRRHLPPRRRPGRAR